MVIGSDNGLQIFRELLAQSDRPNRFLAVVGSIGIGKSYVLQTFKQICNQLHVQNFLIDLSKQSIDESLDQLLGELIEVDNDMRGKSDIYDLPLFSMRPIELININRTEISYRFGKAL